MFDNYKDFQFYVRCNDCPLMLVKVLAENYYEAIEFAKSSYSANYSIYADDRYNKWHIVRAEYRTNYHEKE